MVKHMDEFDNITELISNIDYKKCTNTIYKNITLLTNEEQNLILQELELLNNLFSEYNLVTLEEIISYLEPKMSKLKNLNGFDLLYRIHEIAGKGCLSTNLGIFNLINYFFEKKFTSNKNLEILVSQGHIAPSFYVARYINYYFPISFLFTLNSGVLPGVVTRKWGFNNSLNRPLGIGLNYCVGKCISSSKSFICIIGDGEFQEGITFEALSLINLLKLPILIILNINQYGIDNIPDNINYDFFFKSLNFNVYSINDNNLNQISNIISNFELNKTPSVILLETKKGINTLTKNKSKNYYSQVTKHSYVKETSAINISGTKILGKFLMNKINSIKHIILSPDMRERFSLEKDLVKFINTGMRENSSLSLLLGFERDVKKIVCTDDQFLMYSLGAIEQNLIGNIKNLLIIASKDWGIWNSSNYFINMLICFEGFLFFEPVFEKEIENILDFYIKEEKNIVISIFNAPLLKEEEIFSTLSLFNINNVLVLKNKKAVILYGYSGKYINLLLNDLKYFDIFYINSFPIIQSEIEKLKIYETIFTIEFNRQNNGIGQYLSKLLYNIKFYHLGADNNFIFDKFDNQLSNQKLDYDSVVKFLMENK